MWLKPQVELKRKLSHFAGDMFYVPENYFNRFIRTVTQQMAAHLKFVHKMVKVFVF